jgi:hypothetical protein
MLGSAFEAMVDERVSTFRNRDCEYAVAARNDATVRIEAPTNAD